MDILSVLWLLCSANLPSQVKIDKIRNAHFARNSHIAEYLKDYKYVKDFGEGVDRMYREMEASGLPVPEYRQDSFILKVVIKKSGFESEKTGIALQKTGFESEKKGFALKKMEIMSIVLNSGFGRTIKEKMNKIINEIDENQVIAAKDIMKILECRPTAATEMIKRMCSLNLLKKIEGVGPGRYSLNFTRTTKGEI